MTAAAGPDGLAVVDKPAGWTSHDVVARARRLLGTRKVGHAGTLDPAATGVLLLGVGRATRLLTYLVGADKTYVTTIRLGQATVTDDAEGDVTASKGTDGVASAAVLDAVAAFRGDLLQVPSAVSAIKVDGRRAYARVRAGEDVELAAREVHVATFDVLGVVPTSAADGTGVLDVRARVVCSSGTYVRALARDLGEALGVGGHLTALRRTHVGTFSLDDAVPLDADTEELRLLDVSTVLQRVFDVRVLTAEQAGDVRHGRRVTASGRSGPVAAFGPDGTPLALLVDDPDGADVARPVLVLAPA